MLITIEALFNKLNVSFLLFGIFVSNILDATLTLMWIDAGIASEANPIMNYLLQMGDLWFFAGKILTVTASCLILFHLRHLKLTKIVSLFACCVYIAIVTFHIIGSQNAGISFLSCFF